MRYRLTWRDILIAFLKRQAFLIFPIFIIFSILVTLVFMFLDGVLFLYGFHDILQSLIYSFPIIIGIYMGVFIIEFLISYNHWKKNIIGEHALSIKDGFFIWQGHSQEVRTSLTKLRKFKIKKSYFFIKFEGIRAVKIPKRWAISGYDDFVQKLGSEFTKLQK